MMQTAPYLLSAALAAGGFAGAATADTLLGTFDGNDCAGLFGTPPDCVASFTDPDTGEVVLEETPLILKIEFTDAGDIEGVEPGLLPAGDTTKFTFDFGTDGTGTGTWTYDPGPGDPAITAYAAKGGNIGFNLYANDDGDLLSGTWVTPTNPSGQPADLSHISFYDTAVVPIPAAAWLFGSALVGMAGVGYRRSRKQSA